MLLIRSFPVIFVLVIFLPNGFLGCRSIAIQPGKQSVSHSKNWSLDAQEKGYSYFCAGYFSMLERDWRNAVENAQVEVAVDGQALRSASAAGQRAIDDDVSARTGKAGFFEYDFVGLESNFERNCGIELNIFYSETEFREFG